MFILLGAGALSMRIDARKIGSILLLTLFLLSILILLMPDLLKQFNIGSIDIRNVELVDIDTGDRFRLGSLKPGKIFLVVYHGNSRDVLRGIINLLDNIGAYLEFKGYTVVVVLSGGSLSDFRDFLAGEDPLIFNRYRWLYDSNNLVSRSLGHVSNYGRIFIIGDGWEYTYVGDTSLSPEVIMSRIP